MPLHIKDVNTVKDLSERKIGLRVLTGKGAQIDTTTASGRHTSRVRAGSDPGTHHGRSCRCPGARPQGWP
jgi:hypothetical protein